MTARLRIGTAERPMVGQSVCGDSAVVIANDERTLIAVADGTGHGAAAATASAAFCEVVKAHSDLGLEELLYTAHRSLKGTRGAAVALMRIEARSGAMQYAGVGNIELRSISKEPVAPINMPDMVGHRMRKVRVFDFSLAPGDLLVLFTDGVSTRFDLASFFHIDAQ